MLVWRQERATNEAKLLKIFFFYRAIEQLSSDSMCGAILRYWHFHRTNVNEKFIGADSCSTRQESVLSETRTNVVLFFPFPIDEKPVQNLISQDVWFIFNRAGREMKVSASQSDSDTFWTYPDVHIEPFLPINLKSERENMSIARWWQSMSFTKDHPQKFRFQAGVPFHSRAYSITFEAVKKSILQTKWPCTFRARSKRKRSISRDDEVSLAIV